MPLILLAILILISIASVITAVLLLIKLKTTGTQLKILSDKAKLILSEKPDNTDSSAHRRPVEELRTTFNQLETQLYELNTNLASERENNSALMSIVDVGVVFLDSERHVIMFNQAAENLINTSHEDVLGRPFINLVHDHEMDAVVARCLETKEKQTDTVQAISTKRYLGLTATSLNNGALLLIQDLTGVRRLEKVRQDFMANISHELRTPVTSLKVMVETLQDRALNDKKTARDFLNRMGIETDKLAQMVSELGDLSRIESGELVLQVKQFDISVLIQRVVERLSALAERAHLKLFYDTPSSAYFVMADENRIEHVLVNLVHNAIKFTPQNGEIRIATSFLDGKVIVNISDTGIGIPPDDLPRIFERFYKVDKARSGGGSGLGLAIAKHIIQAHHGDIGVKSEEGKGSVFTISLPIARS